MLAEVVVKIKELKKDHPFTYLVPPELEKEIVIGTIVEVPLGRRKTYGYVVELGREKQIPSQVSLKALNRILWVPQNGKTGVKLAEILKDYYGCFFYEALEAVFPPRVLLSSPKKREDLSGKLTLCSQAQALEFLSRASSRARGQAEILQWLLYQGEEGIKKEEFKNQKLSYSALKELLKKQLVKFVKEEAFPPAGLKKGLPVLAESPEFAPLISLLNSALKEKKPRAFLGIYRQKSQADRFYLEIANLLLKDNLSLLLLIPEISLNSARLAFFKENLGEKLLFYHSGLRARELKAVYDKVQSRRGLVVLGSRGAVLLPIKKLALLVVDKEEEVAYKEESAPRYHARQVAAMRANLERLPILLSSSAPSLESFYWSFKKQYQKIELPGVEPFCRVRIVKSRKKHGIISPLLSSALDFKLKQGEKAVLFCYKRGFSAFLLCESCGFIPACPVCGKLLNFYAFPFKLSCSYCKTFSSPPETCPECGEYKFYYPGVGIQKLEKYLGEKYPGFSGGQLAVLSFAGLKDFDFTGVSLCGVIGIDALLRLYDFRASERAFQLLWKIKCELPAQAEMLVETKFSSHKVFKNLIKGELSAFYLEELKERKEFNYPPYTHLLCLTFKSLKKKPKEKANLQETLAQHLAGFLKKEQLELLSLSFSPAFRVTLKAKVSREMVIKMRNYLSENNLSKNWEIKFDVDPLSLF